MIKSLLYKQIYIDELLKNADILYLGAARLVCFFLPEKEEMAVHR